ncbi:polysaccharide biosynthesis tyrosine autokinase [Phenylobacterium sp.]|jgi:capsular exopolysaccharide synthesis family protein|uniref:GumC family protein n=1 Tax=Phenylobacterium sp. TaxID=1871053 RepID=UPI002F3F45AF
MTTRDVHIADASSQASALPAQFDIWAVVGILQRRWRLLLFVIVLSVGLAATYTAAELRRYSATASVMLNQRTEAVVQHEPQVLSDLPKESEVVDTQVEYLKGRRMAEAVVRKLKLDANPQLVLGHGSPFDIVMNGMNKLLHKDGLQPMDNEQAFEAATNGVLANVDIARRGYTAVIDISYTSEDPELAARIANAYADAYLETQVADKIDATTVATRWLRDRIEQLRGEVNQAEDAVARYQTSHGLLVATGSELTEQRVSQLQLQVNSARADFAEKRARLAAARGQLAAGKTGEELGEALGSPVIQHLRSAVAEAKQKQADLEARYGPRHPDVINSRATTVELEQQVQAEVKRIIGSLENDVTASQGRLDSLRGSLGGAEGMLAQNKSKQVGMGELERNATAKRTLYETYLARLQQTSTQAGLATPDAIVVTRAKLPGGPSEPNVPYNLILGGIGGVSFGAALVGLLELMHTGMRTGVQVEKVLDEPYVGAIPMLRKPNSNPINAVLENPLSLFSESFRQLQVLMQHAFGDGAIKVIAITSALPGEGKTTTSICFARAACRAGARVLLVDCDVRMHSLTHAMGISASAGLLEALSGGIDPMSLIVRDPAGRVCVLPLSEGSQPLDNLLGSPAMGRMLDRLRPHFDLIVLDCPPVLAVADASAVAHRADGVLFLVRWQSTPAKAAHYALEALRSAEARIAGVVLAQVDLKAQSLHGDGLFYHRDYSEYHLN